MFKSSFANGLLNNTPDNIAEYLVSWDKLSVFTQIYNKTKNFFAKIFSTDEVLEENKIKNNEAKEFFEKKAIYLLNHSSNREFDFYLHSILFIRICKSFGILIKEKITSIRELDDIFFLLEEKAVYFQKKQNKKKKPQIFEGNNFTELRKYFLDLMVFEFKNLSKDKQEKILADIVEKLNKLNESELAEFKKKMNIDSISKQTINSILLTGGVYSTIFGTVGLVGFPAYIFLTTFISSLASFVGIALPFGVYKGATVALAFLSSWYAPLLLLVGAIFIGDKQNKKIDKAYSTISMVTVSFQSYKDLSNQKAKDFISSINNKLNLFNE